MSDTIAAPSSWLRALEVRAVGELAVLELARPLRPLLPRGDGHHVIVLPGFTADDRSTRPLRRLLTDIGYRAHGWGLGENLGPTPTILRSVRHLLDRVHADAGTPVSLIGWSLGGIYARELARASPTMVRQVVTLGSPIQMVARDASSAQHRYDALRHLHDPAARRRVRAAFLPPLDVPATSIYSRTDGVVSWQASLIERSARSENIRVIGSHCGLGFNVAVVVAVADRLAQPMDRWAPFAAPFWARGWFPRADDLDASKLP